MTKFLKQKKKFKVFSALVLVILIVLYQTLGLNPLVQIVVLQVFQSTLCSDFNVGFPKYSVNKKANARLLIKII